MDFTNELHKCKFTIPDRPSVRQQLAYYSAMERDTFLRFWNGARALIEKWDCELLPDVNADLEKETNPSIAHMAIWVGIEVSKYMSALDDIPKNSAEQL